MKRAALFLALVSCDATPAVVGQASSSIVLLANGDVAVTNPDQGSVSVLDSATLAVKTTIDVGGEPHSLVELDDGDLLVANFRGGEIVEVDPRAASVVRRATVCAGAYGLARLGTSIAVTCEWEGRVLRVDPATLATTEIASGLRRPRAVAIAGTDTWVADFVGGIVHDIDRAGADHPVSLVPSSAPDRPALTKMSANLAASIVPAYGRVFVAHVLENNTGDTTEPIADDYGTVATTAPKINPIITPAGGAPMSYAVYDGGPRVYSGPSAIAAVGDGKLLVAHASTANVALVDAGSGKAESTFHVGLGASGIAMDPQHHVAWVDNAIDQSVSRIDLASSSVLTLVRPLPSPLSPAALAGRRFFWDATNTHVTPSGVVACASCHPSGSDDGLVWLEHTPNIALRRRRTKNLANAKSPMAPFHWDGEFQTMDALAESTMTNLMGGDGLLVDVSNVQAFIDEIVKPPSLPVSDASAVARGSTVFQAANCVSCHASPDFVDHVSHAVLVPESLTSDDAFTAADTPGLRGVFLGAPYFHDGRAKDLDEVLHSAMGNAASLSDADRADVIAFLRSL